MLETISPEVQKKLAEIGFQKEEINTIEMIHELKTRKYSIDLHKLVHEISFQKLSQGIGETFEKNNWTEEDFFQAVEEHRKNK